jgi:hypothetical protein
MVQTRWAYAFGIHRKVFEFSDLRYWKIVKGGEGVVGDLDAGANVTHLPRYECRTLNVRSSRSTNEGATSPSGEDAAIYASGRTKST